MQAPLLIAPEPLLQVGLQQLRRGITYGRCANSLVDNHMPTFWHKEASLCLLTVLASENTGVIWLEANSEGMRGWRR